MKNALSLLLLAALFAAVGCTPSTEDRRLSQLIVGTWSSTSNGDEHFASVATYRADGTNTETVWPAGATAETGTHVDGTWRIQNGVLHLKSTASSKPQAIPVGLSLEDKIVELSATTLVLESRAGYPGAVPHRATRRRQQAEHAR